MNNSFADLDDFGTASASLSGGVQVPRSISEVKQAMHVEACPKCAGTGIYHGHSPYGHQCFKCGGTGKLTFKTSKEQRQHAREGMQKRKDAALASNLERFEKEHPEIAAWWSNSSFEFALSLRSAVQKYGDLTERQLTSAMRCVESAKERAAKVAQTVAQAPAADVGAIAAALARGFAKGIHRPLLRLADASGAAFIFSRAPDGGKNAGAVYVTDKEKQYLGKIAGGKFVRVQSCTDAAEGAILAICASPETAAVAYGRRFGVCSCCGRELTNKESIDLGIGPVCRSKFF